MATKAREKKDLARRLRIAKEAPPVRTAKEKNKVNMFRHKRSPEAEEIIITFLKKGYSLGYSADQAGVSRRSLFDWRKDDPEFGARVDEAIDMGTDLYEDEMRRRALEGVERTIFQKGEAVGTETVYSDGLLSMALTGRRPEKWGKNRTEISGPNGGPVEHRVEVEFVSPKGKQV